MVKEAKRKGKYGNVAFNYNPKSKGVKNESTESIEDENEGVENDDENIKKVYNTRSPSHSGKFCDFLKAINKYFVLNINKD